MVSRTTALAALLCLAAPAVATAQSELKIEIEPGQWLNEVDLQGTLDLGGGTSMAMPVPAVSNIDCVTPEEAVFTPETYAQDGCAVTDFVQDGQTAKITLACDSDGVTFDGTMDVTVSADGKSTTGRMEMSGSLAGQGTMTMTGDFKGTHQGACG